MPDVPLQVLAWGDDGAGQCMAGARSGLESVVSHPSLVSLPVSRRDFVQVAAGWEQSFLVTRRGHLWGAGSNRGRCLSDGTAEEEVLALRALDVVVLEDFAVAALAAGREHFVAIEEGGAQLLTWACSNEFGQSGQGVARLGVQPCPPARLSLQLGVRVCAVACGQDHVLALTERGEVFSWGDGSLGQLGTLGPASASSGDARLQAAPRRVEAGALRGLPVRQVAAGMHHSMALGLSGQVACWGCNRHGRLGLGIDFEGQEAVPLPTLVVTLEGPVKRLAAGGRHSAVVLRGGGVFLAGDNRCGQLGHPVEDVQAVALFLELPLDNYKMRVRMVALGEAHTLFLSEQGTLYGMGANDRGQLGEPVGGHVDSPMMLKLPNRDSIIWAVAAGQNHAVVLSSELPAGHSRVSPPLASLPRSPTRTQTCPNAALQDGGGDDSPLRRTLKYNGHRVGAEAERSAALVAEPEPVGIESDATHGGEDGELVRLLSRCNSKISNSGKLVVPLAPRADGSPPSVDKLVRVVVPVVRPGVASRIGFACLGVEELAALVRALPAAEACEQFRGKLAVALKHPTVLSASFLFESLTDARLNASVLCEHILEARKRLGDRLEVESSLASAVQEGVSALAPPGGLLKNVRTRDQVRALLTYLLVPNWPLLLAKYPESETRGAFDAARCLLVAVARLPVAGRAAFRDVVADECGDAAVLREVLLPAAGALAGAALKYSKVTGTLETPVWEAVLLLQLLWAAEARRLEIAAEAVKAAREAGDAAAAAGEAAAVSFGRVLARSFSKTSSGVRAAEAQALHTTSTAAGVALPRTCFQIEGILDAGFPAQLELVLFQQNAQLKAIDPRELLTDKKWEIDDRGRLPVAFMSFMANGNLMPTAFKQQVLQAENLVRQRHEQQQQVFGQAGGFMQMLVGGIEVPIGAVFFLLEVRRERLLHDTMVALQSAAPEELKKPLKVKFADEDGVDEGGVAREYFHLLSTQLFDPSYGMFKSDPESHYIWFNPGSFNEVEDFWTVGAVVGLAVYNNLPGLDVNFPLALFKMLKEEPLDFDDFRQAFPAQAASLQAVLNWTPPAGVGGAEAEQLFQDIFCLDFSVSYDAYGAVTTVALHPSSPSSDSPPPVTLSNRIEFAEALRHWYCFEGVKSHVEAFKSGFGRVCGSPVFSCLSASELEAIVCGEKDLDFGNLRKGAQIVNSPVNFRSGFIEDLWSILESFDAAQKRQFLKFVTGSDLAPVGGLERIGLKIQRNGGEPTNHLPTSHTCFNLLTLPEYESREKLQRLLVSAIANAEGFGLE